MTVSEEKILCVALALNAEIKRQWRGRPINEVPVFEPDNWTATADVIDLRLLAVAAIAAAGEKE